MRDPDNDFRIWIARRSKELRNADDEQSEEGLAGVIEETNAYLREGGDAVEIGSEEEACDALSSAIAWASVISFAVTSVYAPMSPFPRQVAGWAKRVCNALLAFVNLINQPIQAALAYLKGVGINASYSVGLNFPGGPSVSLNFP